MTVCPKCGFNGQDPDTCERCGIIYSRMHTVMDVRPAELDGMSEGQQGRRSSGSMPRISTPSSVPPARPKLESPEPIIEVDTSEFDTPASTIPARPGARAVPAIAQAFPGMPSIPPARPGEPTPAAGTRPVREVTVVPIVPPPPAPKSKAPWLIGLLAVCLIGWGVSAWMERHRGAGTATVEVDSSVNEDYFAFQLSELVDEARRTFREVKDPEATKKDREAFGVRIRYLRTRVTVSAIDDAKKQTVTKVLDEVAGFLKEDVGAVLTALEAEKAKAAAVEQVVEGSDVVAPSPSPMPVASPSPMVSPSPAPTPEVKPAVAVPVSRKPSMVALNRATSALASLKTE